MLSDDVPAILLGHFAVKGAVLGAEQGMTIIDGAEVDVESLLGWDYVALGHLHKHQNLLDNPVFGELNSDGNCPPIVYSGSLERVDFSEEFDDKGFCWITIDGDNTSWEFIEVDARPFVTVDVDVKDADKPTAKIIKELKKLDLSGSIVRIRVAADLLSGKGVIDENKINRELRAAGVSFIQGVMYEHITKTRHRLEAVDGTSITSLSRTSLIDKFLEMNKITKQERKSLLDLAKEIMGEVDE